MTEPVTFEILRYRPTWTTETLWTAYAQLERADEARESYRIARDLTGEKLEQTPQDLFRKS